MVFQELRGWELLEVLDWTREEKFPGDRLKGWALKTV
jgi:hypothetical protein